MDASLKRLGAVLERLGASWRRLGALLQAIWLDAENVEKPLVFLAFGRPGFSWRDLRGVLERLGSVLELSWRYGCYRCYF